MCDIINYVDHYNDKIIVSKDGDLHSLKDFRSIVCSRSRNNEFDVLMKYANGEVILLYIGTQYACIKYLDKVRQDMLAGKLICGHTEQDIK